MDTSESAASSLGIASVYFRTFEYVRHSPLQCCAWHRPRTPLTSHQMPRIRPSVLFKAYWENPLLPLLLKECRTLESARNELRWLREHALRTSQTRQPTRPTPGWRTRLMSMCHRRSRGYPLQYILGDQPFGDLEILCRPGVLIPRSDFLRVK